MTILKYSQRGLLSAEKEIADWCDICNERQFVAPDGEHLCGQALQEVNEMSYIITTTIPLGEAHNSRHGVDMLLREPEIRILKRDTENEVVTLDMRGDFEDNARQVRWLCGKLVDAGILEFSIGHSY